jgi:superfamily II DNA/RNA helicase
LNYSLQEVAIPQILRGNNNMITAETGCGKTLAYLVPLVQNIMLEKRGRRRRGVNQPLAIILVPSRELADQIYVSF